MRFIRCAVLLGLSCFLPAQSSRAQIDVAPGGFVAVGGAASGGRLTLVSSAGQAVSTAPTASGNFSVVGGLLSTIPSVPVVSIAHTAPDVVPLGQELLLEAAVNAPVREADLHYRIGGSTEIAVVAMVESNDRLTAAIPSDNVTDRGLAYYLVVVDSLGRTVYSPFVGEHGVRVQVPDPGIVRSESQPAGTTQAAYRLVSFPLTPEDNSPVSVVADDLGSYDPDVWRFFELAFNQQYVEFQDAASVEAGRGYWLITSESGRVLDTGQGVTTSPGTPFRIPLHPQWNLVGVPFNFPVSVEQVALESGQPTAFRAINDGWNDPVRNPVTTLQPFEGYAVFSALQSVDVLVVQPTPPGAEKGLERVAHKTEADDWSVHIGARTREGVDADNVAGIRGTASEGWDSWDLPEPPLVDPRVTVSFPRPGWKAPAERFSTDMRPPFSSGQVWDFEVTTAEDEAVTLSFDGIPSVPPHFDVWLIDELAGVHHDLRRQARYQFAAAGGVPYRLRLMVGTDAMEGSPAGDARELPASVVLHDVYPNPFTSAAAVRFSLPEPRPVMVTVYDALGAEVVRLLDGSVRSEGMHLVVWDGRRASGVVAGSGVYFVNLLAGTERTTRKVVLVR